MKSQLNMPVILVVVGTKENFFVFLLPIDISDLIFIILFLFLADLPYLKFVESVHVADINPFSSVRFKLKKLLSNCCLKLT